MAPIALATGRTAYTWASPIPDVKHGLHLLGVTPEESAVIGDRMDTDIISAIEAALTLCWC
jgi:NagD protein